jgi:hypothetical protein
MSREFVPGYGHKGIINITQKQGNIIKTEFYILYVIHNYFVPAVCYTNIIVVTVAGYPRKMGRAWSPSVGRCAASLCKTSIAGVAELARQSLCISYSTRHLLMFKQPNGIENYSNK